MVHDLNGNGTIDNGGELFGVDTLMPDGTYAPDGFTALSQYDANGDGEITAADQEFSNLMVWHDLNQDGITQAGELSTLADLQIVSITVNPEPTVTDLGDGNMISAMGTFVRADGGSGSVGQDVSTAANLGLAVNAFAREFIDKIPLTDQARMLPEVYGSGMVRDLREASSLSPDLADCVRDYTSVTTRQGQIDMLDEMMEKWAATSELKPLRQQAEALAAEGVTLTYVIDRMSEGMPKYDEFMRKLSVVEPFMGFTYAGARGQAQLTPLDESSGHVTVVFMAVQVENIERAYELIKMDIYHSLLLQTRHKPLVDALKAASENIPLEERDFGNLESLLSQGIADDTRAGFLDLLDFINVYGYSRLRELGWNAEAFLFTQLETAGHPGAFTAESSYWTVRLAEAGVRYFIGGSLPDVLVAADVNTSIYARGGDDILAGGPSEIRRGAIRARVVPSDQSG